MNFPFIKYKKVYFIFSGLLVSASILAIAFYGLNWGIDFVGGSVLKVSYIDERPTTQELSENLSFLLGSENFSVRFSEDRDVNIKMPEVSQETKDKLSDYFYNIPEVEQGTISFESVSPIIGGESKGKAQRAIILSVIAIVCYVAFVFRKVSNPIKSWQYGIATVIALLHDVLIPVGALAVLGRFSGVEFSIPILTALLTIFGYSVNDTVVVFDRIRENLIRGHGETFSDTVNLSLNETIIRSVNTSFTTLFVLLSIFFFGGVSLNYFSLVLIIGVIAGTYSSIFLASTLLTQWLIVRRGWKA
ncbi:MAG: protein translocase subunit SecF [Patescibacteria group bacterium]|nr:protein translocase subunit SecF [Patescibacteria group bacterium]